MYYPFKFVTKFLGKIRLLSRNVRVRFDSSQSIEESKAKSKQLLSQQKRAYELEVEAKHFKDSLLFINKDVAIRIESEEDTNFWDFTFQTAIPELRVEFFPESKTRKPGSRGKSQILLLKEFADRELVLCIDSDYDYLLENESIKKTYIFQTYVYSIENYWSYAEGLQIAIENSTDTQNNNFRFVDYMKIYSNVIYDWLIYSIYSKKMNDGMLSVRRCGEEIGFDITFPLSGLRQLKPRLKTLSRPYEELYGKKKDFQSFKTHLSELGLNKDNAYSFVRGHDLFDRVIIPLMKVLVDKTIQDRFNLLRTNGDIDELKNYSGFIKRNKYAHYLKFRNKAFKNHPLFQKIICDIKNAFKP
jgi:hypothetical protein